jgi:hypothetical protein
MLYNKHVYDSGMVSTCPGWMIVDPVIPLVRISCSRVIPC